MGGSPVLDSAVFVVSKSNSVTIDDAGLEATVELAASSLVLKRGNELFDTDVHFVDGSDLTAQYLLVVDTLNFCFWPDAELQYAHLAEGVKRWLEREPQGLDAHFLASATGEDVQALFGWPRPVPLQAERARLLREVGRGLLEHYGGQAAALVRAAQRSAQRLVALVTAHFPGFRDHAVYCGHQIFFYKRAQIFVADVYGAYGSQGMGAFDDIDTLTMFADYRVPVVLRELGVLKYSTHLEAKIASLQELTPGSEEEVEIRAASIVAIDRLTHALRNQATRPSEEDGCAVAQPLLPLHIDWWLWEQGERKQLQHSPHHRTLTVYY